MVKEPLSRSETYIMQAVWDYEGDIPMVELVERLNSQYGRDYQRTTVATFLVRLAGKGFVETYRVKKYAYIHPLISQAEYKSYVAQTETALWFSGSPSEYLSALCSTKELTREEIERIRVMLDGMDH